MKVDCIYKFLQKDESLYLETTPYFPKKGSEFSKQMNNLYYVRGDNNMVIYNRDGTYSTKVGSSINSEDVSLSEKINAKGTWECDGDDNFKMTWINEDGNPVTWYSKDGSKKVGKPEDIKKPEVKEKPKGDENVDNTEKEVNVNVNSMSRKTPQPPNVKSKSPNTGGISKNNPKGGNNSNLKDNYSKSDNSVYVNPKDL